MSRLKYWKRDYNERFPKEYKKVSRKLAKSIRAVLPPLFTNMRDLEFAFHPQTNLHGKDCQLAVDVVGYLLNPYECTLRKVAAIIAPKGKQKFLEVDGVYYEISGVWYALCSGGCYYHVNSEEVYKNLEYDRPRNWTSFPYYPNGKRVYVRMEIYPRGRK